MYSGSYVESAELENVVARILFSIGSGTLNSNETYKGKYMNKSNLIGRIEQKDSEMKVAQFKRCPLCKCEDLLKFEVDHFCMKCDWSSILFDVHSGNFEKRIGMRNRQRTKSRGPRIQDGVIHLEDLRSRKSDLVTLAESTETRNSQNNTFRMTGDLK